MTSVCKFPSAVRIRSIALTMFIVCTNSRQFAEICKLESLAVQDTKIIDLTSFCYCIRVFCCEKDVFGGSSDNGGTGIQQQNNFLDCHQVNDSIHLNTAGNEAGVPSSQAEGRFTCISRTRLAMDIGVVKISPSALLVSISQKLEIDSSE